MLKLQSIAPEWLGDIASDQADDPRPFLLSGVRVAFNPIDDDVYERCQQAMTAVVAETGDNAKGLKAAQDVLLRHGIAAWEGIGDAAGEPIAVTPATVEAFIRDPRTRWPAIAAYVTPFLAWDTEGNASAGSPPGTGATATLARTTAASRAAKTGKGALSARTRSMRRSPRRAKASGG